jgi:hypothetical protein
VGPRLLEIIGFREKQLKKETKYMQILQFVSNSLWKNLFGKNADALEKVIDTKNVYLIKVLLKIFTFFCSY